RGQTNRLIQADTVPRCLSMKNVVTVCGKIGWDRIDRALASESDARWTVVREIEDMPPRGLTDTFKLSLKSVAHYRSRLQVHEKSSLEAALDVVTSIGNAEIAPGVNLRLHLLYRWFSSWWILEPALREHVANLIESVRLTRRILETEKPDRVYVLGKVPRRTFASEAVLLHPDIVVAVARQEGIDVVRMRPIARRRKIPVKLAPPSFIRFCLWAGSRARRIVYGASRWFRLVGQQRVSRGTIAVVSDHSNWRSVPELRASVAGKNDAVLDGVLNELDAESSSRVLLLDFLSLEGVGLRAIAEKVGRFAQIGYRPLELYVGKQVLKDVWMHAHLFRTKWDEVKDSPALQEAASFEGVELWKAVRARIRSFFRFWLPLGVYYAEAMDSFIRREKPDSLLIVDEQGMYGRCFLAAAQAHGVATIGMQHRIISRDDTRYTHCADTVPSNGRFAGTTLCPIPDATAVYGELFKRVLVERGGYSPNSVIVTGQPSHDFLHNMRDDGGTQRICRQLGVDPGEEIAVLVTQTHRDFSLDQNRQLLEMVFEAIRDCSHSKLVVKLHPAEEPSLHRQVALEKGVLDAILIVKDVRLCDLLRACELVITAHPRMALDAMLFGKPVIAVNVTGARDAIPYAESGAAIGVRDAAELGKAIRTVLKDGEVRKKLQEATKKFLADCLHTLDGKAAQRVTELALSMAYAHLNRTKKEPGT
ncbi:MAG: CDP-glycerol glycerophosphotransferase family protein, partial [Candidatus Hydrogenedentes bacterium]|nr:CDP-glycerol glycerophosphotransferase family protein [Candidatus Hydrogenedentota bacterium]